MKGLNLNQGGPPKKREKKQMQKLIFLLYFYLTPKLIAFDICLDETHNISINENLEYLVIKFSITLRYNRYTRM